jgi:hypothetical protein
MKMGSYVLLLLLGTVLGVRENGAQTGRWTLGGRDLAWSAGDSMHIFIDFSAAALRPVYIEPDRSVFSLLEGWKPLREPREIDYVEGEVPRSWKGNQGNETTAHNGTYMVDGDSMSFNPPVSSNPGSVWYTIDLGVPVPAHRFGFFTPPRGYRSDGTPFAQDAVPAFEVSIAPEGEPQWLDAGPYEPIGTILASVAENFAPNIQLYFPRQYVRFVRYKRLVSLLDGAAGQTNSTSSGAAFAGTIGDFELFAEGVPRRAVYRSDIFDLGKAVNFGRLHWAATPMRKVDGELVEVASADVGLEVEVRTGRDGDPNIYHEYTDRGGEQVVDRDRFEFELQPLYRAGVVREPRPGMRASIEYDSENWSFWTAPFTRTGQRLDLRGGSHLQLRVTLKSEEFDALLRLDSLWVETSPLLAQRIVAEVARADDPLPVRGFTQVELGQATEFVYEVRAFFAGGENGFDALRIRTGAPGQFRALEIGDPPVRIEPVRVVEEAEEIAVYLPERISSANPQPLRVLFSTQVFALAWTFDGEVFDAAGTVLPQPLEPGNASEYVDTSALRVVANSSSSGRVLRALELSSNVLTPNGDGINDAIELEYTLFQLPEAVPVSIEVYSLDGRLLLQRKMGRQHFGPQQLRWDGRDEVGSLLRPGLYLLAVALEAGAATDRVLRPVGIAY